jgi:hypothetical protein
LREWHDRFGAPPTINAPADRAAGRAGALETAWEAEHPYWPSLRTVRTYCTSLPAALEELGLLREPPSAGSLADRVRAARRVSAGGLGRREIAVELGGSASTVGAYLRAASCRRCGPVAGGRSHRCRSCALALTREADWPRELVLERLRAWHHETGRVPGDTDWRRPAHGEPVSKWQREFPA